MNALRDASANASEPASAPRPLPAWFAKAELVLLRAFATISMLFVLAAVAIGLGIATEAALARTLGLVGIAVMLATPFLRLALLIAAFLAVRDRLYVVLSIAILAVLFAGFLAN